MELSEKDRVILYNQYELLKTFDKEQADNYQLLQKIVENGYSHEYHMLYPSSQKPQDAGVAEFVWKVLQMFDMLDLSYDDLEEEHKGLIEKWRIEFGGFDGNEEYDYLAYAAFVLKDMRRYSGLWDGKKDLNSHARRLNRYQRKLTMWETVRDDEYSRLSFEQIKAISEA